MLIFLCVNAHNINSSIVKRWAFGFYVIELGRDKPPSRSTPDNPSLWPSYSLSIQCVTSLPEPWTPSRLSGGRCGYAHARPGRGSPGKQSPSPGPPPRRTTSAIAGAASGPAARQVAWLQCTNGDYSFRSTNLTMGLGWVNHRHAFVGNYWGLNLCRSFYNNIYH